MEFRTAVCQFVLGELREDDLPAVAMEAIDQGCDCPSLFELAASQGLNSHRILALFSKTLEELQIPLPSRQQAGLEVARAVARDVLRGNLLPYDGAKRIWGEVCTKLPELSQLRPFVGLASEYEDDLRHREDYDRMIVDECRTLIGE